MSRSLTSLLHLINFSISNNAGIYMGLGEDDIAMQCAVQAKALSNDAVQLCAITRIIVQLHHKLVRTNANKRHTYLQISHHASWHVNAHLPLHPPLFSFSPLSLPFVISFSSVRSLFYCFPLSKYAYLCHSFIKPLPGRP